MTIFSPPVKFDNSAEIYVNREMRKITVPLLLSFTLSSFHLPPEYALEAAPVYNPDLWNGSADNEDLDYFYGRHQRYIEAIIDMEREKTGFAEEKMFSRPGHEKNERALFVAGILTQYRASYKSEAELITAFSTYFRRSYAETAMLMSQAARLDKDHGLRDKANCYTYAANANSPDKPKDPRLNLSVVSDTMKRETYPEFVAETIKGSEKAGLIFTGQAVSNERGFYNVVLLARPAKPNAKDIYDGHEFHWLRQNPDGSWSHKYGPLNVTDLDFSGQKIEDVRKADFGNYRFIGYFKVPEGGIRQSAASANFASRAPL